VIFEFSQRNCSVRDAPGTRCARNEVCPERGAPVPVLPSPSRDSRRPARMRQGNPQVRGTHRSGEPTGQGNPQVTGGSGPIAPGLHPSDKPCLMSHAGSQSGGSFMPGAPSCRGLLHARYLKIGLFQERRSFPKNGSFQKTGPFSLACSRASHRSYPTGPLTASFVTRFSASARVGRWPVFVPACVLCWPAARSRPWREKARRENNNLTS
jgi:hypothetical protein